MVKYSVKEVQNVLNESNVVTSNVAVCNELRTQVIAESAKDDDKRMSAYDSLHSLYVAYQKAKAAFDNAVNYALWQDSEFAAFANTALSFAAQNVAHMRGMSTNFVDWTHTNGKLDSLESESVDITSIAKLASVMCGMIEDYKKAKEQANAQTSARRSKAERLAAARAAAAAAMAEAKQLEAELEESK